MSGPRAIEKRRNAPHRITERDGGPDLDDLVRLIRYLREHGLVRVEIGWPAMRKHLSVVWRGPRWVAGRLRTDSSNVVTEGARTRRGGVFVGPDGTVYDENREAL